MVGMKVLTSIYQSTVTVALLAFLVTGRSSAESLQEGTTLELNGRKATLKKLDTLPYVQSEYTKRFKFDSYDNPKLTQLRGCYKLEEVIAPGKDEFEKQVLL